MSSKLIESPTKIHNYQALHMKTTSVSHLPPKISKITGIGQCDKYIDLIFAVAGFRISRTRYVNE